MVILSKKRILIVLSAIIISTLAFTLQTANIDRSVQTVALPVSNKVIVLDARTWKTR